MTRTIDFDAFRAERNDEPVTLKLGGKEYVLGASLPAVVAIDLIHLKGTLEDADDVPIEMLDKVGRSVFGETTWREVLETHRVGLSELSDLIQLVLKAYTPERETEDPTPAST